MLHRRSHVNLVAADLAATGIAVLPGFVRPDEVRRLRRAARLVEGWHAAGVGRAEGRIAAPEIRGDHIAWLEPEIAGALGRWLARLDRMRVAINRRTFAGLYEWEGHVAHYPPGAGYHRHRDRFRDQPGRVVSTVLYLNEDWTEPDGGQLRVWSDRSTFSDIEPLGGTLVAFWSEDVEHAVLPTTADRWAITGWFRVRPALMTGHQTSAMFGGARPGA